jgi:hypothetical protein
MKKTITGRTPAHSAWEEMTDIPRRDEFLASWCKHCSRGIELTPGGWRHAYGMKRQQCRVSHLPSSKQGKTYLAEPEV